MKYKVSGTKARILYVRATECKRSEIARECPSLDRLINVGAIEKADAATSSARATCANSSLIKQSLEMEKGNEEAEVQQKSAHNTVGKA